MTVSGQLTALSTALDISEANLEFLVSPILRPYPKSAGLSE
jgi:hypothetical protein